MKKAILSTLCSIFLLAGLIGCEQDQGPAEEAGEQIDETIDNVQNDLESAGDAAMETAEDLGNEAEDACEDVKEGMNAEDTDC